MMSVRSEKDAVYASLFFQIAHYALRPWPWIIVALAALVLYPELPLEDSRKGFVLAMRDHLPVGLKGLLLVGFLSAYMSTISTQLNWGSSYLTNDLYRPFIARQEKSPRQYVRVGRLITLLLMLLAAFSTAQIQMIDEAATFLIASGAGLGMVLILRWYWWRINAWSELSATLAPLLATAYFRTWGQQHWSAGFYAQNGDFIAIVLFTTATWLLVTFLTKPTDRATLQAFWQRIRPGGWWAPIRPAGEKARGGGHYRLISWLAAVLMVYAAVAQA
jgi:Na+/proline symporter